MVESIKVRNRTIYESYCTISFDLSSAIILISHCYSPFISLSIIIIIQETLIDVKMGLDRLSYNMKNAINNAVNEILLSSHSFHPQPIITTIITTLPNNHAINN